jgi:hypothetical protein
LHTIGITAFHWKKQLFRSFSRKTETFWSIFLLQILGSSSHTPLLTYPWFSLPNKEVQKLAIFPLHPLLIDYGMENHHQLFTSTVAKNMTLVCYGSGKEVLSSIKNFLPTSAKRWYLITCDMTPSGSFFFLICIAKFEFDVYNTKYK